MAIPPVAPMLEVEDEESGGGMKVAINCAAADCKFNMGGKCSAPSISVSTGPEVKCETYEAGGEGEMTEPTGSKIPRPPLPPMAM